MDTFDMSLEELDAIIADVCSQGPEAQQRPATDDDTPPETDGTPTSTGEPDADSEPAVADDTAASVVDVEGDDATDTDDAPTEPDTGGLPKHWPIVVADEPNTIVVAGTKLVIEGLDLPPEDVDDAQILKWHDACRLALVGVVHQVTVTLAYSYVMGRTLFARREALKASGERTFMKWLATLQISKTTAYNYMEVFKSRDIRLGGDQSSNPVELPPVLSQKKLLNFVRQERKAAKSGTVKPKADDVDKPWSWEELTVVRDAILTTVKNCPLPRTLAHELMDALVPLYGETDVQVAHRVRYSLGTRPKEAAELDTSSWKVTEDPTQSTRVIVGRKALLAALSDLSPGDDHVRFRAKDGKLELTAMTGYQLESLGVVPLAAEGTVEQPWAISGARVVALVRTYLSDVVTVTCANGVLAYWDGEDEIDGDACELGFPLEAAIESARKFQQSRGFDKTLASMDITGTIDAKRLSVALGMVVGFAASGADDMKNKPDVVVVDCLDGVLRATDKASVVAFIELAGLKGASFRIQVKDIALFRRFLDREAGDVDVVEKDQRLCGFRRKSDGAVLVACRYQVEFPTLNSSHDPAQQTWSVNRQDLLSAIKQVTATASVADDLLVLTASESGEALDVCMTVDGSRCFSSVGVPVATSTAATVTPGSLPQFIGVSKGRFVRMLTSLAKLPDSDIVGLAVNVNPRTGKAYLLVQVMTPGDGTTSGDNYSLVFVNMLPPDASAAAQADTSGEEHGVDQQRVGSSESDSMPEMADNAEPKPAEGVDPALTGIAGAVDASTARVQDHNEAA